MATILLVIHIIIALSIIVLVLLQRSEGGALGIGGGGNFMSGRSLGNALTRTTAILAGMFFLTSIGLTLLSSSEKNSSVLDSVIDTEGQNQFQSPLPALPDAEPTPPTN